MYTFESRVRYSEVSEEGTLALGSLINYIQDCSTFQSEDMGLGEMGIPYFKENKVLWLLKSWQIQIERLPVLAEKISISTWCYGFEDIYGYWNFVINDSKGNHLVMVNAIFLYYDVDDRHPVKITEEDIRGYGNEPKLDMVYADRTILMPEHGVHMAAFPVRKSQIDTFGNVNNGHYVRMAQEYIPKDFKASAFRVEYRKSAVYGDMIYPVLAESGNEYVISLNDDAGKAFAVVAFESKVDKKAQTV